MPSVEVNRELADRAREQLGDAVKAFLSERTAVDSPLFDVSTKMAYGNYASVRSIPLLMDLVNARLTPEEVGRKLKTPGVPLGLVMNGLGWVLTMGRIQVYKDAGWPEKTDVAVPEDERMAEVFTWWARIMAAYRNDGGLVPGQGGTPETFEILSDETLAPIVETALTDGAFDGDGKLAAGGDIAMLQRSIAELDMFEFVTHAEARDGIHQHGPYRLDDGRVVLFKEFTDLQGRYMPGKSDENRLSVSRVVVALVMRDVRITFDLFAIFTDPENFFDHVEGVAILAGDDLKTISLPELSAIAEASVKAQRNYFLQMAGWDDRTKVTHGGSQYANDFHALLPIAGYTEEEVASLWIEPFEKAATEYYERATGDTRLGAFEHLLGGGEPVTPPFA
ncbi:hypothetical protein HUN08_14380 [Gordonia sp. X0973]|uniref:hypothetical protein n=1 Tax=Gordonia sp. X0973 TaxID=2742602 RepID=UPI000F53A6BE|nr:hypothetical protein [Gordonia sp. X0973]QKT08252.1 hypothetical protein HUN08_14380 [Gordonia sp. X0973]